MIESKLHFELNDSTKITIDVNIYKDSNKWIVAPNRNIQSNFSQLSLITEEEISNNIYGAGITIPEAVSKFKSSLTKNRTDIEA